MVNTTGVSDRIDVQTGNTNARYSSYAEATIATIKSPMDSPQECVGGTQNPEVPRRAKIMEFLITVVFSCMASVTGAVRQSESL